MAKYTIRLDTPRLPGAGTNAHVWARIFGERGTSAWRYLDNPGDDREQGSEDYYRIDSDIDFGRINRVGLAVRKGDNDGPDWLLEGAFVVSVATFDLYYIPYNNWIYPPRDGQWVYLNLWAGGIAKLDPAVPSPFIW